MSLKKKKRIEFDWTEDFERNLTKLLLAYRFEQKSEACALDTLQFERAHAAHFIQKLLTLIHSRAPELAGDSDITAALGRLKLAHDGAHQREIERYGGVR